MKQIIVLTCGTFDIIHNGHIDLFEWVLKVFNGSLPCDRTKFIVALNSDTSLSKLSRKTKHTFEQRYAVLNAIRYIDLVIPMDEEDPYTIVRSIKPDYFIKGPDYKGREEDLPETKALKENGKGQLIICPYSKVNSSTSIREYLAERDEFLKGE